LRAGVPTALKKKSLLCKFQRFKYDTGNKER